MKLFKQLLLLMLALALAPTAAFGWLAISANRDALVANALELSQERVEKLRLAVGQQVTEASRAVEALALRDLEGLELAGRQAALAQALTARDDLAILTLYGPDGERLPGLQAFPSGEVTPEQLAAHDERARALVRGAPRAAAVHFVAGEAEPRVTIVVPVPAGPRAEPSRRRAVTAVAAEVRLGAVQRIVAAERLGPGASAYVVDEEGRIVAHPDEALAHRREPLANRPAVTRFLAEREGLEALGGGRVAQLEGPDGSVQLVGFASVPALHWGVIFEQPRAAAWVHVNRARDRALLGLGVAALIAAVLAAFAARGVTRPIRTVVDGALQIAKGGFGAEVPVQGKNELADLARTFNYMSKQLLAYDAENKALYESLEQGYLETIVALANSIDSKDAYTRGHSQRVADLSRAIGEELGQPPHDCKMFLYGGILHDIGKIGIVERILCKQARLTDEEMLVMRGHPEIGATIVEPVRFLAPVLPAIRSHHERWDGAGYPDGLRGDQIPLIARVVNCADTWDACTSTRPYQVAMPVDKAMQIMTALRGTQLAPPVVDALFRVVEKRREAGLKVTEAPDSPAPAPGPAGDAQAKAS